MLENINSPEDLKSVPESRIPELAAEIRGKLLETVSENGGHLASNLCVVELTIALHRVFNSPKDKIIFDVGHQSYVHKLLTGRYGDFCTLRRFGGISGFPRMCESEHDAFGTGHSSTSISAAAGIAAANRLAGDDSFTVAVVGDGAFTGGMIYEALNNCAGMDRLIIVLNDNDMSISPNVGGMSRYFSKFRSSAKYFRFKSGVKHFFGSVPLIGNGLIRASRAAKNRLKKILLSQNFFEQFGLGYYGPVNGNDEKHLEAVLREARNDGKCSVVHICTKKGKGYVPAEEHPECFHGVSGFDIETGRINKSARESFSERFGKLICDRAEKDGRIVAVTAAMPDGTGLSGFAKRFPERFFDVGIAEEHAMTFSCGMAARGCIPVFAVYSTFMQRAYDQFIHDAALQGLHVILALDRAGIVGGDGPTHHGIFDVAETATVPGVTVYSPATFAALEECFDKALAADCPVVIRYPRGGEADLSGAALTRASGDIAYSDTGSTRPETALITYGRISEACAGAAAACPGTRLILLERLEPLDTDTLERLVTGVRAVVVAEEVIKSGGIGERICARLSERGALDGKKFRILAIDGVFPPHGKNELLLSALGLDKESIVKTLKELSGGDIQ